MIMYSIPTIRNYIFSFSRIVQVLIIVLLYRWTRTLACSTVGTLLWYHGAFEATVSSTRTCARTYWMHSQLDLVLVMCTFSPVLRALLRLKLKWVLWLTTWTRTALRRGPGASGSISREPSTGWHLTPPTKRSTKLSWTAVQVLVFVVECTLLSTSGPPSSGPRRIATGTTATGISQCGIHTMTMTPILMITIRSTHLDAGRILISTPWRNSMLEPPACAEPVLIWTAQLCNVVLLNRDDTSLCHHYRLFSAVFIIECFYFSVSWHLSFCPEWNRFVLYFYSCRFHSQFHRRRGGDIILILYK